MAERKAVMSYPLLKNTEREASAMKVGVASILTQINEWSEDYKVGDTAVQYLSGQEAGKKPSRFAWCFAISGT